MRPLFAGDLPEDIKALMLPHIENHERILKAALTYDKEAVVQAFLHDPLVQGKKCQEEDIRLLAEDMIRATLRYLPKEWAK